jgi:serine/threonine protein kinase/Tol biopolymer transport system component
MHLSAGERLGPYEIIEPIGSGGMGEVYKASDTRLGRIVAIKTSNERFSERFEHEARAVAALNHPNICTLYDVGPNYLVMEYIEGESPKGPMPLEEALRIARQIADALEAAHERGITHRDLKPANIKVKPGGAVKVLDFGLAKVSATTSGSDERSPTFTMGMTEAGMVLGTASYMAPEQARGKAVDKRADIFAFGVVLHELITGRRLFGGEDAGEMLAKVIRDEPDLSDAPPSVRRLISECLQKDPRKRLRDIGDVWRLLDSTPAAASAAGSAEIAKTAQRYRWLLPALAALLLVSTGALALVHFREKPPESAPMRFEVALPPKSSLNMFAVSPDGRKLAFNVRGEDGHSALWLRMMDSLQARQLPGTEDANLDPAWSPDSQSIAFFARGSLRKIDISGGTPQVLAPYANPATGIWWGRNDVILYGSSGAIHRIAASGGEATAVTTVDAAHGEAGQGRPFLLPDGKHFLYFRAFGDKSGVYSGSLDAKPSEQGRDRLLDSQGGVEYVESSAGGWLLFLRGAALMAQPFDATRLKLTGHAVQLADQVSADLFGGLFSASNTGLLAYTVNGGNNRRLTWYDRSGKILEHVGEPAVRDELAISPDGTRIAEGRTENLQSWSVWMLDLARGASTRLTFESGGGNAVWSPDGSQIIYAPGGGQSKDLYLKPASGAEQGQLLLHSDETKWPQDWSRDGRFFLYAQLANARKTDLWVLPLMDGKMMGDRKTMMDGQVTGDRKPVPYLVTPFSRIQAQFSPDGRWVVYASNESGAGEVYVQPFPSAAGGKWVVSNGGGSQPRWSRDGKELFYFTPNETLMAVDVTTTGGAVKLGIPKALFRAPVLGGTGGAINLSWRWDISPDGKRFLINTALDDAASAPLTVLLNWPAALR